MGAQHCAKNYGAWNFSTHRACIVFNTLSRRLFIAKFGNIPVAFLPIELPTEEISFFGIQLPT